MRAMTSRTAAVTGSGVIQARLPGHRTLCLTPLRNSASTSARRYRGLPASLRTSGSRPRRAQLATAAEVTPNKDATCLRVIRSSLMGLPAIAVAAIPRAVGRGPSAGRPDGCRRYHVHRVPGRPERIDPGQRWSPHAAAPGQGPGKIPNCPVPVALKMLLQIATRNIGQLTDIEPIPGTLPAGGTRRREPARRTQDHRHREDLTGTVTQRVRHAQQAGSLFEQHAKRPRPGSVPAEPGPACQSSSRASFQISGKGAGFARTGLGSAAHR
jgi:hypothetical protein